MTAPRRIHRTQRAHAPDHAPHKLELRVRIPTAVLHQGESPEGIVALLEPISEDLHSACVRLRAQPLQQLAAETLTVLERYDQHLFLHGYSSVAECYAFEDTSHPSGQRLELLLTLHPLHLHKPTIH